MFGCERRSSANGHTDIATVAVDAGHLNVELSGASDSRCGERQYEGRDP